LRRIDAISEIAASQYTAKALIVANLGYASRELYSLSDRPNRFYMLGSMGLASSIGLGLALAQKRRQTIVIDGDGSVLMNLGSLASIGNFAPSNFHLIIVDNHAHGSTGNQRGLTSRKTDLVKIAIGAGVKHVSKVHTRKELRTLLQERRLPTVLVVDCVPFNASVPVIPLSARQIKRRFMLNIASSGSG